MEKWDEFYRMYISVLPTKAIFQQEGFVEGTNMDKSNLFYKYFNKGNVDYVGVGNRRRGNPNKEVENSSFRNFITIKNIEIDFTYRQIIKSAEAEYKSASKYDRAQPELEEEAWKLSGEWTIRHFGPGAMKGSYVVSQEVAWREMDKQTSPGWPHNLVHKNKATLYLDKKHMSIVDTYWDMIADFQHLQTYVPIWQCSEKTELRAVEKIKEKKIRTFTSAPVEHSVALNRMCLDMNNKFYNSNGKTWSFVGATKFNCGFHKLWQRLSKHPNAFELDESAFDSSLFLRAMADMVDIRYEMLADEEKTEVNYNRLLNLYQSIIHSVIIMENGEITWKHTGNPSGSSNTIVDNTVILFRLCAYAWILLVSYKYRDENKANRKLVNEPDVKVRNITTYVVKGSYHDFMTLVEAALNGDDNTMTVSDEVVNLFNATTVAEVWSKIGVITNTPNADLKQKVETVQFLSQGFSLHHNLWLPTPETNKVLSSLMYGSEIDDPRWHLLRANALRVDSWANLECRHVISMYIEYLLRTYKAEYDPDYIVTQGGANIPMREILSMWRSDEWIFRLYSHYETGLSEDEKVYLNSPWLALVR